MLQGSALALTCHQVRSGQSCMSDQTALICQCSSSGSHKGLRSMSSCANLALALGMPIVDLQCFPAEAHMSDKVMGCTPAVP